MALAGSGTAETCGAAIDCEWCAFCGGRRGQRRSLENFPEERHRRFSLMDRTRAEGVIFVNGDLHYSDCAVINDDIVPYHLWDITSNALNQSKWSRRSNTRRLVGPNFGLLQIKWSGAETNIRLETWSAAGTTVLNQEIPLRTLSQSSVSGRIWGRG